MKIPNFHPPIPTLFITGTDTGVGKTLVAGAIARVARNIGLRVAVLKPVATGCVRRREGLVSEDAEFLAFAADSPHPLDLICPQRYLEPLAPAVAAERAHQPLDFDAIARSVRLLSADSDLFIVEGVGGILVPLTPNLTVLDFAVSLAAPTIIVSHAGLGSINHSALTTLALRTAHVPLAGLIINRYPAEAAPLAEETNLRAIPAACRLPLLAVLPALPSPPAPPHPIPADILAPLEAVDWLSQSKI